MQVQWGMMQHWEVFTLADRPASKNIVKPLWTFGYKYDAKEEITKWKARLVAKGYTQIPGLDFDQMYASVVRLESMRMTAAIITCKHLKPWQIDYVAAYLNSNNKFEVYMEQPWPFVVQGKEDMVLWVNKTVYGMMQAAYDWEDELSRTYKELGYYQSQADPCI
ncbi:unnamed protein product [Cyclocybe aegerita]|uniref:Reverse transcriptase Ty1/copia-type domain-containing protein n=1 Tax=Cyclocybe aegerita TaxID=1973307 RepID=A0A8S0XSH5_CYCAE|nr:unnamed protein product [Cyclocybe aegerita]